VPSAPTERRIALFLDFENLVTNTGVTAANFDLAPAMDQLLERGKVVFRRAYCDWSRFREAKSTLHQAGVELIDVPPSTRAGKNAADMRLVIDALELCYAREHINTFAIGSGDSDFCPLAYKLRENDRHVIGLAVKQATSPLFVKACDEFLYLNMTGRERPHEERSNSPTTVSGTTKRAGGSGSKGERPPREVPAWVREATIRLLARATGPINPSFIKETLVRREPDFDERDHGFSTFFRLLEALQAEGLLKLQQLKGRQWYVSPPEGALPTVPSAEVSPKAATVVEPAHDDEEAIPDPED
jgi:uncharacterized LabA/DUF88 family protein